MADLDWSQPPATGPILDSALRAVIQRTGLYIAELPGSLSGQAGKVIRVRADESGCELATVAGGGAGLNYAVRAITGNVTLGDSHLDLRVASGTLEVGVCYVRHSTPSSALTITLPANATPGKCWTLVQALDQTGTVTLTPATGATLQGGTGSATLDGPGAVATVICVANSGGSAAQYLVAGGTSFGQVLSGTTVLGAIRGQYHVLGSDITANVTLGASDVGTERRITASGGITVTVPSGFTGEVRLRNVSAVSHTIALTGVGNRTLTAGALGVVDGNGVDLGLRVQSYAAS